VLSLLYYCAENDKRELVLGKFTFLRKEGARISEDWLAI